MSHLFIFISKVVSIFLIGAGIGVMILEKTHAAISSLPIQTAPILLLIAGLFSLFVGCLGLYCWKKKPTLNEMRRLLKAVKRMYFNNGILKDIVSS